MKQIILPSTNLEFTWLVIDGFMEKNFSPDKKVFVGRGSIPALMQAVFTSVTTFGREKIGAQKIKKQFFSKKSSVL